VSSLIGVMSKMVKEVLAGNVKMKGLRNIK
jgi:hypothetical protein